MKPSMKEKKRKKRRMKWPSHFNNLVAEKMMNPLLMATREGAQWNGGRRGKGEIRKLIQHTEDYPNSFH